MCFIDPNIKQQCPDFHKPTEYKPSLVPRSIQKSFYRFINIKTPFLAQLYAMSNFPLARNTNVFAFASISLSWIFTYATASPARIFTNNALSTRATSDDSGWALAVLSQKEKLSTPVTEDTYYYLPSSGEGVDVYIVDSGVNHIDGLKGVTITNEFVCKGDDSSDKRNHGTAVASLVTSRSYGSAKKANIYSYKVDVNDSPDVECVLEALKRIVDKVKERKTKSGYNGSVINLSLNLPASDALENRIAAAIGQNIAIITTPSNEKLDSTKVFPCAYDDVICVGAIDKNYARWIDSAKPDLGSGYGAKVTVWAPGVEVDCYANSGKLQKPTGTSYAAPLVAGIVATYYGWEGPSLEIKDVRDLLNKNVEKDLLSGMKGKSPNKLANNGYRKAGEDDDKPYLGAAPKPDTTTAAPPTNQPTNPATTLASSPSPSPTS